MWSEAVLSVKRQEGRVTSDEMFALKPQLEAEAREKKKAQRIDRMHLLHGRREDARCGDCLSFLRRRVGNTYFKCERYGVTHGPATDWRANWTACGKFEAQR